MKFTKRFVGLILTLVLLLGMMPKVYVHAATPTVFLQYDSRWGTYQYGYSDAAGTVPATISSGGCGILSYVNAIYYLTGNFIEPTFLADYSVNNGHRANGDGTKHSLYSSFASDFGESYGFTYVRQDSSYLSLANYLQNGDVAIFTVPNHIMACVDYDSSNGKYLVLDSFPSSNRGTSKGYAWKTEAEMKAMNAYIDNFFHVLRETTATTAPDKPTITTTTAYYAEGSDISISWTAVLGNTCYWINVYKDGKLIVDQAMGNDTTYILENAAKGEYEFAVSANNSIGTSGGSQYSFLVGLKPEKPEASIAKTFYTTEETVTVNWEPILGNTYYWVSVYRDGELIINQTAGNSTTFSMQADSKGAYEIQVSSNNRAGTSGSSKCLFLVDTAPEKPEIMNETLRYNVGDSVVVDWSAVVGNVYYWINVYKEGELIVNQTAGNQTSYTISSVSEGVYKVFVSANNSAGTSGSDSYEFVVGNPQYTISYDANGGTGEPKPQVKIYKEELILSNIEPIRDEYLFLGWSISADATAADYQPGDVFTIDADTSLYAVWQHMCTFAHSYGNWYTVTEATCTTDGQERRDCANCDHYETREVTATGHNYTSTVTAPTCTEQGYTTHTCACGDSYVDSYVDATGHTYGNWYTVTEATCTTDGQERRDCADCDHYETQVIAAKGHSYKSVATKPTCTAQGYTTHTCACGDSYVDSYVDATGHTYGNWYTVTGATCTADGQERRDCANCDASETQEIKATGHSYKSVVTAPTCAAQGYTTHTCSVCGNSYVDSYTSTLGHAYSYVLTAVPTAEEPGTLTGTCARCQHTDTVALPMLSDEDYSCEVVLEPTTTEPGTAVYTWEVADYGTVTVEVTLEPLTLLGDVNGDGEIDILDANLVVAWYNEIRELDDEALAAADVNGDGDVDIMDANMIVAYYNEFIDAFPAEQ